MSELGRRVAVAVVAIPVVLGLVYLGGWFLAVPLAAFAGAGAWELFRMASARAVRPVEWVGVGLSVVIVLLAGWRPAWSAFAPLALGALLLGTLVAALEAMRARGPEAAPLPTTAVTLFGALYTGLPLACGVLLASLPSARGWTASASAPLGTLAAVSLPLAATWVGDAAAYFAGTAWGRGRARLAPTISPNKSWVGFWASLAGGGVAGLVWALAVADVLPGLVDGAPIRFAGAGAVLGLAAVLGDLLESLFKREAGVKDSGTFFPGHGGVLDRIDSLILTLPVAYALLLLLGGPR